MNWVDGVLLDLQPIAGNPRETNELESRAMEELPVHQTRSRRRTEVGPDDPGLRDHGVCLQSDLCFECSLRVNCLFKRLLGTLASLVEHPTVVRAPNPAALDDAIRKAGAAM